MSRLRGSTSGAKLKPRGQALPEGWTPTGKGLWHHENGARVEYVGTRANAFEATDPDGVRVQRPTRAEAMDWASGAVA